MAFRRLQPDIMKTKTDHSLFVWRGKAFDGGLLARSPDEFARGGNIRHRADNQEFAFEMTNLGLRITLPITGRVVELGGHHQFAYLSCDEDVVDPGCEKLPIGNLALAGVQRWKANWTVLSHTVQRDICQSCA